MTQVTTKYYDARLPNNKPYWDVKDAKLMVSHHSDINNPTSPRNYGKSYALRVLSTEYMDKGEIVGWGRYSKNEMAKAISAWQSFNPELEKSKDDIGNIILTDPVSEGRVMFFYWKNAHNNRDTDYPFCLLTYDEIVPPRYTEKPRLDTEFNDWYDTDTSFSRSYNPIKFLICNNIVWQNPYYLQWDIVPFSKGKMQKTITHFDIKMESGDFNIDSSVLVWNIAGTDAIIKRNIQQQALKFRNPEELQAYYDNETNMEYTTIGKCPDKKVQLENYCLMSQGYYIGIRSYAGKLYFEKVNWNRDIDTYVSEPAYVDINKKHFRYQGLSKEFEDWFNAGICIFDNAQTLNAFYRWLRHNRQRL